MLIFAIDDEEPVLEEMVDTLSEAAAGAEIRSFSRGEAALDAIRQGARPDVVFSDIEMPGISGLQFAVVLKDLSPETRVVFATGYERYAVQAFRIKAHGYLLKPLAVEEVREELSYIPHATRPAQDKLVVRCFGHFDVFWQGQPVIFTRRQSKELFAYLVDRRGAACTSDEIALALWETGSSAVAKQRIRNLLSDLRKTLVQIGMEKVLIREHRQIAVRKELLDCDYYRMLDGDIDAINAYHGEYMVEYGWAEMTNAKLYFTTR